MIDCLGQEVIPLEEKHPELAQHFMDIADHKLNAYVYCGRVFKTNGGFKKHRTIFNEILIKAPVKPNNPCICGSGKKYKKCCG